MKFDELNDFEFVTKDLQTFIAEAKKFVENKFNRQLAKSDPLYLLLCTLFAIIFQLVEIINDLAKQNLLKYARKNVLDHMGVFAGVDRLQPKFATVTAKVTISTPRPVTTVIRQGTRFHAGDNVYFQLDSDAIFLPGDSETALSATCLQSGVVGNDYDIGELCKIVDPQPFLKSVENVTVSSGGSDLESDDDYRERIRISPEQFTVAGSYGAYYFHTKSFSNLISDVFITSESAGEVDIYPLMLNGNLPTNQFLLDLQNTLSAEKIRPITDFVQCKSPKIVNYNIDLVFVIAVSDSSKQSSILNSVEIAVNDFVAWQKSTLGRDINVTELYKRVREAGAKRCEITSPVFFVIPDNSVAVAQNISVRYAGLEND